MCQFEFSRGKGVEVNALGVMPCGLLDPCVPWNVDVYTTLLPRKTNVDTFFIAVILWLAAGTEG